MCWFLVAIGNVLLLSKFSTFSYGNKWTNSTFFPLQRLQYFVVSGQFCLHLQFLVSYYNYFLHWPTYGTYSVVNITMRSIICHMSFSKSRRRFCGVSLFLHYTSAFFAFYSCYSLLTFIAYGSLEKAFSIYLLFMLAEVGRNGFSSSGPGRFCYFLAYARTLELLYIWTLTYYVNTWFWGVIIISMIVWIALWIEHIYTNMFIW